MSELEQFLEELGGEGEAGEFTIDYATALRQMRRYQLGNDCGVLESLVMSAVASGACSATFSETAKHLEFVHDGVWPNSEQLRTLFNRLLSGDEGGRYLAMAVNSALAEPSAEVSIWSPDKKYVFGQEQLLDSPWTSSEFRVRLPGDLGFGNLWKLAQKTRFAPLELHSGGRWLNSPGGSFEVPVGGVLRLYDPEAAGDHFVVSPSFGMGRGWTRQSLRSGPPQPASSATVTIGEQTALHCSAVVAFKLEPNSASELIFYRHGVEIARKPFRVMPGVVAMVGSEGLQLDLSSHQVVENSAYQDRLNWLQREVARLSRLLRKAYPTIDTLRRREAAAYSY